MIAARTERRNALVFQACDKACDFFKRIHDICRINRRIAQISHVAVFERVLPGNRVDRTDHGG